MIVKLIFIGISNSILTFRKYSFWNKGFLGWIEMLPDALTREHDIEKVIFDFLLQWPANNLAWLGMKVRRSATYFESGKSYEKSEDP